MASKDLPETKRISKNNKSRGKDEGDRLLCCQCKKLDLSHHNSSIIVLLLRIMTSQ